MTAVCRVVIYSDVNLTINPLTMGHAVSVMVAMKSQLNLPDDKTVIEETVVEIKDDVITDLEKEVGLFS